MLSLLLNLINNKSIKFILIGIIVLSNLFLFYQYKYWKSKYNKLLIKTKILEEKITDLSNINNEIVSKFKKEKVKYEKKINELLKLANKPPKIIRIPKIITKKVYITPQECKKMCVMIDEFIKIETEKIKK